MRDTGALRCAVKLAYRGRSGATVAAEIAPAGAAGGEIDRLPAKPLDHLGLDGPSEVPCLAVRWQIAQKLHACTEPARPDGPPNDRFRDIIDILRGARRLDPAAGGRCAHAVTRRDARCQRHPSARCSRARSSITAPRCRGSSLVG